MASFRLVQLSRIYGKSLDDDAAAAACIAAEPQKLGHALLEEAAASDDVTSVESAREYLSDRLAFFDGLLSSQARDEASQAFEQGLRSWTND